MAHRATELADLIQAIADHNRAMLSGHDATCHDQHSGGGPCRHYPTPWLLRQITEVNSLAYDLVASTDFDDVNKETIVRNVLELRYTNSLANDPGTPSTEHRAPSTD